MPPKNQNVGLYLAENVTLDTGYLNNASQYSPELLKQLIITLEYFLSNVNKTVNQKDSALYILTEFVTGQQFFPDPALSSSTSPRATPRPSFRKVIQIPTLANAGTTTVAHGITVDDKTTFVRIYGTANDVGASKEYIPLPFVDVSGTVAAGNIELRLDDTNVHVTTTGNGTNFTINYVVVEFLKQ
jgi:hypothetical protein